MGEDLFLKEATEPTNIIWENRHFTEKERWTRKIHAMLLIFLLVFASFAVIYYVKVTALNIALKYPSVDCVSVTTAYGPTLD